MLKLAAVAVLLSGCSIALQSKPSHADCSTTHAYWIADAVGVAAGVAAMAYAVHERGNDGAIAGGPGAIGSVLYLASAGNGIRWRRECSARRTEAVAVAR